MVWLLSMSPQSLSLLAPELPCLAFLEFFSFSALMCLFSPESMRMWGSAEASLPPGSLPGGLAKSGPLLPSGALPPHTHHPGNLLRVWHLPWGQGWAVLFTILSFATSTPTKAPLTHLKDNTGRMQRENPVAFRGPCCFARAGLLPIRAPKDNQPIFQALSKIKGDLTWVRSTFYSRYCMCLMHLAGTCLVSQVN